VTRRRPRGLAVAAGLVAGFAADRLVGDPQRGHPVAAYGRAADALARRIHADGIGAGMVLVLVAAAAPTAATAALQRRLGPAPLAALTGVLAWSTIGGAQLGEVAGRIHSALDDDDLQGARAWLPWLVGRDPSTLDAAGIARAVVESVAENTADAIVGPLVWGAIAGPAGLVGYRAVNTLDAMVGHRDARNRRFGTAAARTDDVANLLPARLTAALIVALAHVVGGTGHHARVAWRRDGGRHPSPNAGPVEAAAAGALGITLGGRLQYGDRVEVRGPLGDGPPPAAADIARVVQLTEAVARAALVVSAAGAVAGRWSARREPRSDRWGRP
jgi:adenosylcobinamide-phosphate synthase